MVYLASTTTAETLGVMFLMVVRGRRVRNACQGCSQGRHGGEKIDILIWIAAWGWLTVVLLVGSIVFFACEGAGMREGEGGSEVGHVKYVSVSLGA